LSPARRFARNRRETDKKQAQGFFPYIGSRHFSKNRISIMFHHSTLNSAIKRTLIAATISASSLFAGAAQADYHFDFSQENSLNKYAGISFSNAVNEDIYDSDFNIVGQHWVSDLGAPAVTLEAMSNYGQNGSAAAGVTGLQALWQPVLMKFATPLSISSLLLRQDDSSFGFPGYTQLRFLNANGQQIGNEVNYLQAGTVNISSGQIALTGVSSVMLASGKFYTNIDVISAVPEAQSYAMLLAGLAIVGLLAQYTTKRRS
jgi:hypothetical protein